MSTPIDSSTQPVVLRRLYPVQHPCPVCKCTKHEVSVWSRSRGHSFVYRKCAAPTCGEVYKVALLAVEVENPDGSTKIIPPP